jgi:hypothetical protein
VRLVAEERELRDRETGQGLTPDERVRPGGLAVRLDQTSANRPP